MNLKKNICTTLCSVLAVSTFCVSVYATDTKTKPTDALINKAVMIERSAVKVEDGVIKFKPSEEEKEEAIKAAGELLTKPDFYPFEIQYENHNGSPIIIKSFKVPADFNPNVLVESDFEEDGYKYKKQDILTDEPAIFFEKKVVAEPVAFSTKDNKPETLRSVLEPILEYDKNGFKGQLLLDYDSIVSIPSAEKSYSYPIVKTIEVNNLSGRDYAFLRKQMNGLTLTSVDWEVQSGSDDRIPDLYTAYATYSGTGYGKKTAGYVNTAFYTGTVSHEAHGDKICSVIYKGEDSFPWSEAIFILILISAAVGVYCLIKKVEKLEKEDRNA